MRHTLNPLNVNTLGIDFNDPKFAPPVQAPKPKTLSLPERIVMPFWATWIIVGLLFLTAGTIVVTTALAAAAHNRPVFPAAPAKVDSAADQRFILELEVVPLANRHAYCLSHLNEVAAVRQDPDARLSFVALMRVQ